MHTHTQNYDKNPHKTREADGYTPQSSQIRSLASCIPSPSLMYVHTSLSGYVITPISHLLSPASRLSFLTASSSAHQNLGSPLMVFDFGPSNSTPTSRQVTLLNLPFLIPSRPSKSHLHRQAHKQLSYLATTYTVFSPHTSD